MIAMAVLGAGRVGRIHIDNVARNRRARLVAIADPSPAARDHPDIPAGCVRLSDPYEALQRQDVDAIIICTPTDTHIPLTLAALAAGKAVLCEKPIGTDLRQVDQALVEISRRGGNVMIGFNRRFDPGVRALHEAISNQEAGEIRQVIITSRDPGLPPASYLAHSGGIFLDMAIHDFDLARWLLGEEPTNIVATGSRLVDPSLEKLGDYDTIMVQMKTASGRQCHINCCRDASYGYDQRLEVLGSAGMLQTENLRPHMLSRWTRNQTDAKARLLDFFLERYAQSYWNEMEQFIDALICGNAMPVTPHDGRQALRLAELAMESARTGAIMAV